MPTLNHYAYNCANCGAPLKNGACNHCRPHQKTTTAPTIAEFMQKNETAMALISVHLIAWQVGLGLDADILITGIISLLLPIVFYRFLINSIPMLTEYIDLAFYATVALCILAVVTQPELLTCLWSEK